MSSNGDVIATGDLDSVILELESVGAVKFGEFTLKSGLISPVYFDLRVLVSFPKLLDTVSAMLLQLVDRQDCVLCGVPYTALPIATLMSVKQNIGMVVRRKEAKDYGTKKMVEGRWTDGQNCVIVEDVITSGGSVIDTAKLLETHGMKVTDCVVLLDREQGAVLNLNNNGITVRCLVTVSRVLEVLLREKRISETTAEAVKAFVANNQTDQKKESVPDVVTLDFTTRLASTVNPVARRLMETMLRKQSNLCVAVDKDSAMEIISTVKQIGSSVAVVKLHADAVKDWSRETEVELKNLAKELDFMIFEDRKMADIGNTVRMQALIFSSWADLVTVHGLPGPGLLQAIKEASPDGGLGALLVAEMSNAGNLFNSAYTAASVDLGIQNTEVVVGFIAQSRVSKEVGLLQLTPGVHLSQEGDSKDQRYTSPKQAVMEKGADIIIVGRGITGVDTPKAEAEVYRQAGWQAYLDRTNQ